MKMNDEEKLNDYYRKFVDDAEGYLQRTPDFPSENKGDWVGFTKKEKEELVQHVAKVSDGYIYPWIGYQHFGYQLAQERGWTRGAGITHFAPNTFPEVG